MKTQNTVQYKDLSAYSATIGAVNVHGTHVQMCDYIEAINGEWYALAYVTTDSVTCSALLSDHGVITKHLPGAGANDSGLCIAYVPHALLSEATPQHDDEGETSKLLTRLSAELTKLNNTRLRA